MEGGAARAALKEREARALALRAQGVGGRWSARRPAEALERLGVLQLDSVSVVARPQDLVPATRLGPYDVASLHQAVYDQKRGFEYWGHEASWLPMAEYRYFRPRMAALRGQGWWGERAGALEKTLDHILERIRAEGPLTTSDFEGERPGRGVWWDRKPAKQALELLFASGDLMCARRTAGFARVYDLPERVLPAGLDTSDPGPDAAHRHLLLRSVAALGVATARDAADYYRLRPDEWRPALRDLVDAGQVQAVTVEGWKEPGYVLPGALERPLSVPRHRPAFLSPFDNLIWFRERTERLFGFFYRIEIYVPEARRQYGYYALPLLARGRLVGRADLKLERKERLLRARGVWLEGSKPATGPEEVAYALRDLAAHLGADAIAVERLEPAALLNDVRRLVA